VNGHYAHSDRDATDLVAALRTLSARQPHLNLPLLVGSVAPCIDLLANVAGASGGTWQQVATLVSILNRVVDLAR
jgi:hypothetical protein